MAPLDDLRRKTCAFFHDDDYTLFSLGGGNPMRPHRVRLTNHLVDAYGLKQGMVVHRPRALTTEELNTFHADGARLPGPPGAPLPPCGASAPVPGSPGGLARGAPAAPPASADRAPEARGSP